MPIDDQSPTATFGTEVPVALVAELRALVARGSSHDLDDLILDALRRYAESHRDSLMDEFVREDVNWGLRGSD